MKRIFIAGIDTGVGKTTVASIITEALQADYWKPVQAGGLEHSDTMIVRSLLSNSRSKLHPEAFRLTQAISPHAAAIIDGVKIKVSRITLPATKNRLVIEGPGGIMVPLSYSEFTVDLITHFAASVVLVSQHYLGSINHTMLSLEALFRRNIPVKGIVFNGPHTPASEDIILQKSGLPCILKLTPEIYVDKGVIKKYADQVDTSLLLT